LLFLPIHQPSSRSLIDIGLREIGAYLLTRPCGMGVMYSVFRDYVQNPIVFVRRGFESSFTERHVVE
jgi:hypothetical protein